jgi:hypothetical protein
LTARQISQKDQNSSVHRQQASSPTSYCCLSDYLLTAYGGIVLNSNVLCLLPPKQKVLAHPAYSLLRTPSRTTSFNSIHKTIPPPPAMTLTEMITTLHPSLKMKFQASRFLLLQLFLLSICCCDKAQSFALSPHHYSSISRRHHHHHARQVRIDIAPLPTPSSTDKTTTALKYRSDSDLPEDASSSQPTILPVPLAKKKATKAKTSRSSSRSSGNKIEAAQKQKERRPNRSPPVRRSFLHQLDRFLTELQGNVWCDLFVIYAS